MYQNPSETSIYFFTATILNWNHLLAEDKYKNIILESLLHLHTKRNVKIYAFVIMPNHIHLIWKIEGVVGADTNIGGGDNKQNIVGDKTNNGSDAAITNNGGRERENVQRDFLKFTGQQILFDVKKNNLAMAEKLFVNAKDRNYQVWERNSFSFELYKDDTFFQKLNYVHSNPCNEKWKLSERSEDYFYSSANFYLTGKKDFQFLTDYHLTM